MDQSIEEKPATDAQEALARSVLGGNNFNQLSRDGLVAYFEYYFQQCKVATEGPVRQCWALTHQDIAHIVQQIREAKDFEDIMLDLRQKDAANPATEESILKQTIWLAARLLCMHDIGELPDVGSSQENLDWTRGSLQERLKLRHGRSATNDDGRFGVEFSILSMIKMAGFRVLWTDNLLEHLRFRDHNGKRPSEISIFPHVGYLKAMLTTGNGEKVFPQEFVQETLTTLALLFGYRNKPVRKWFHKERYGEDPSIDPEVLSCRQPTSADRHLKTYRFWRQRLMILQEEFDNAQPDSLSQWWFDRRDKVQRATFWIAVIVLVLTIFFGLTQSIEGALQVYKAYYPTG